MFDFTKHRIPSFLLTSGMAIFSQPGGHDPLIETLIQSFIQIVETNQRNQECYKMYSLLSFLKQIYARSNPRYYEENKILL